MTENSPFGGLAVAEPQTSTVPMDMDDSVDAGNRKKLAIVGAAAGVLVLLVAAFFLMKGSGGNAAAPVVPHITPPSTTAQPAAPVTHKATKPVKLPKSYAAPVGRDPFKALYVAPAETAPQTAGGSSTVPVVNGPGAGSVDVTTSGPTPVWVELVSVNGTSSATFLVAFNNGQSLSTTKYRNVEAPKGSGSPTIFANFFGLVSLSNGHATVQYGDGTPIEIVPGPSHRLVVN